MSRIRPRCAVMRLPRSRRTSKASSCDTPTISPPLLLACLRRASRGAISTEILTCRRHSRTPHHGVSHAHYSHHLPDVVNPHYIRTVGDPYGHRCGCPLHSLIWRKVQRVADEGFARRPYEDRPAQNPQFRKLSYHL